MNTPTKGRKDRPITWAIIVAVLFAPLLLGINFLVVKGSSQVFNFNDKAAATEEEEEEITGTPVDLDTEAPSTVFLHDLADNPPGALSNPSVDFAGNPNNVLSWVCDYAPAPLSISSVSLSHPSEKASVTVHTYGAGQGREALDNARSSVSSCSNKQGYGSVYTTGSLVQYTEGFSAFYSAGKDKQYISFFIRGDVMVSVSSSSFERTTSISQQYDEILMDILPPVCESLEVSSDDAGRNPYYDRDSYTGWQRGRKVTAVSDSSPALVPGILSTGEGSSGESLPRGNFPKDITYVSKVEDGQNIEYASPPSYERPLDPVPLEMPKSVSKPDSAPIAPSRPDTEKTIPERVEDKVGPGCGWEFSSMAVPPFDASEEKERADNKEKEVRASMRENYNSFLANRKIFIFDYASYAREIYDYNGYLDEMREVGNQWQYVNAVRNEYRAHLDEYWRLFDQRESFDNRQKEAQEAYDEEVRKCEDQLPSAQEEWQVEMDEYEDLLAERNEAIEQRQDQERRKEEQERKAEERERERAEEREREREDADEDEDEDSTQGPEEEEWEWDEEDIEIPPMPDRPRNAPTLGDCLPSRPNILDQAAPSVPAIPEEPSDVELPSSWNDIP